MGFLKKTKGIPVSKIILIVEGVFGGRDSHEIPMIDFKRNS